MYKSLAVFCLAVMVCTAGLYAAGSGWLGRVEKPGAVLDIPVPSASVDARQERQATIQSALFAPEPKRILFGDLHVHTTFSSDAFNASLPVLFGNGASPPSDACDFARYCSALDFWSINDHAFSLSPRMWKSTVQSIRQCNAVGNDPENPDVVAFLGWEWTQSGLTPSTHFGHKNVVVKGLGEKEIPTRPIMAGRPGPKPYVADSVWRLGLGSIIGGDRRYFDLARYQHELAAQVWCEDGPVDELSKDCMEQALTPDVLFDKLDEWEDLGVETLVIPHGTAWGNSAPPNSGWANQQSSPMHDPRRQTIFEVFSGHGNSEEYREWRANTRDENGAETCPEPTEGFLPSCWRAGQIIEERCLAENGSEEECSVRSRIARQRYVEAGRYGRVVVPGTTPEDWLDSGQCVDCFLPAFNYRPAMTLQYLLANQNAPTDRGQSINMGVIASSDNHAAKPGTGYKEQSRKAMTDSWGVVSARLENSIVTPLPFGAPRAEPIAESVPLSEAVKKLRSARQALEVERRASYMYTGGLAAVHAAGRDRNSIWSALQNREVYGTSGDRILLWFDLIATNDDNATKPVASMGANVEYVETPRFHVRVAGAFKQLPGCPDYAVKSLSRDHLNRLCGGECYNPSNERKLIEKIQVIRIRPKLNDEESISSLIEDPWMEFQCDPNADGCEVSFSDTDYVKDGRHTLYYVRAIQEPTPTINGDTLRCTLDENGRCIDVEPCFGGYQTDAKDDCLAPANERAWSSPIALLNPDLLDRGSTDLRNVPSPIQEKED